MGGVTGDDIEIAPVERESGDGASLLMFVLNILFFVILNHRAIVEN